MNSWSEMTVGDVNLEILAQTIRETGQPVHINVLARSAVRAWLEVRAGERIYAPGARYAEGETIQFKGQQAKVKEIRSGGNPKQGQFKILTLVLPDGTEQYMAAEVAGAPDEVREPISEARVRAIVDGEGGLAVRTAVQEALGADGRFVWFQDAQGDWWCLAKMLPEVGEKELAQVWPLLQGLLADGILHPRPTEELVKEVWGQKDDGSPEYLLRAFALNVALQGCQEVRWLGDGWILEEEWQQLQERTVLAGPRQENLVALPKGVTLDEETEGEEEVEIGEGPVWQSQVDIVEEDLETWKQNRRRNATITLNASHYYGNWMPLTRDMRRVFPPRASRADTVTFYHHFMPHTGYFEGDKEAFQAWVDWDQGRILGSPQMYQAFYANGIYPGARLVISHRDNLREYDIRTKPATKGGTIRVRRVFLVTDEAGQPILDEEGHPQVEYEEIEEPRRYEISDEVFIAAASWEDLPALFAEADRVGQGYFGLMYEVCCEWWEARGRKPLYITADELFQELYYHRRLVTSAATIPWELWRRLAFEAVGDGKYRFRPEKGDWVRPIRVRRRRPRPLVSRPGPEQQMGRPPEGIVEAMPVSPSPTLVCTRSGQLVASNLVPPGPLFEERPASPERPAAGQPTQEPQPIDERSSEEPGRPAPPPPVEAEALSSVASGEPAGAPGQPPGPSRPRPEPLQPAPPGLRTQASKSLFSQHYLDHRIREHPEWGEAVAGPFGQLRALYEAKRDILPTFNEAQTEAEFIRPALEILGFAYIPQTPTRRAGRVQRPDYALFADEGAKAEAYPLQSDEPAFYARALAIADAKYWERPLSEVSRDDPRDAFKNTNPSFQMVNYLIGTGVDWGILTNGRAWRLYYRQASSTATEFYEVDLVELLESGDPERFKRFWLFFRRPAFIRDAQGRNFLERVREGSATYARVIGDRLKAVVFEEVFPFLSGGFVAYGAARAEDVTGEAARRLIYEATLSLLYKMLFLLYAEARNLLPVENPGYQAQGLTRMAREVAERMDRAKPLGQASTALYGRLLNLFHLIDQGDAGLGLPRYNGGLFHLDFSHPADREKHRANWFLTRHKVPDAFLAPALERLYRAGGEPIDYGFIGVRHLGAIYEGLLEHRLHVDDAAGGRVHLETDRGERKATGSYYTPDYIVKYIVRHALGPILEERAGRFDELMEQIVDVRRQLADGRRAPSVSALREGLERLERQARETLLDIKVCDPAIGSGHFLVEAVDFLTDGLIEILNRYPEHNPILTMLDRIRRDIVASLERQGIALDPARLDDTQLLQRVVMKRCIYGVDLNPMAVELAKVSLWLHSFTVGAPLSFLDHHLRCGNSLIGAMAREAHEQLSREQPLFGGPFAGLLRAAEIMRGISLISDATFAEVEESERLFGQFDEAAKPYKRLLDIYVARHFGVERADEFLRLYGPDVIQAGPDTVGEPYTTVIREARRLYEEKRFFHWDLEFPEVFIDLERATWKENPGFDAVVGNPPYDVLAEKEREEDLSYLLAYISSAKSLEPALGRKPDLFRLFTAKAANLVSRQCVFGLIVPMSLLADQQTFNLRHFLLTHCRIVFIEAFPQKDDPTRRIFSEAKLPTCIVVAKRESPDGKPFQVAVHPGRLLEEVSGKYQITPNQVDLFDPKTLMVPLLTSQAAVDLAIKLASLPHLQPSGKVLQTYQGEINETTMRGLLSLVPATGPKVLRGGNVQRYEFAEDAKQGTDKYLNVKKYRGQAGGRRVEHTQLPRFGYQRNAALDNWRRLIFGPLPFPSYCFDSVSYYLADEPQRALAYLALLNSQLLEWRFRLASTNNHVSTSEIAGLPFPRIAFTTPPDERARLVEVGITEATDWIESIERAASVPFSAFSASVFSRWLDERLSPVHTPDPELLRRHNADLMNEDWQLPETGPVEQSDVIHNLLAHLAQQMIEMNQQKQAEVKGFLAWLERETGASVDDLTGKTRLLNYLGDYQKGEPHLGLEELLEMLRKNRRLLRVDPGARAFQERLAREYQASLDRLLPLKARLAATDRLIDLSVYRLYRLTEEEVAIVEGSGL